MVTRFCPHLVLLYYQFETAPASGLKLWTLEFRTSAHQADTDVADSSKTVCVDTVNAVQFNTTHLLCTVYNTWKYCCSRFCSFFFFFFFLISVMFRRLGFSLLGGTVFTVYLLSSVVFLYLVTYVRGNQSCRSNSRLGFQPSPQL